MAGGWGQKKKTVEAAEKTVHSNNKNNWAASRSEGTA